MGFMKNLKSLLSGEANALDPELVMSAIVLMASADDEISDSEKPSFKSMVQHMV